MRSHGTRITLNLLLNRHSIKSQNWMIVIQCQNKHKRSTNAQQTITGKFAIVYRAQRKRYVAIGSLQSARALRHSRRFLKSAPWCGFTALFALLASGQWVNLALDLSICSILYSCCGSCGGDLVEVTGVAASSGGPMNDEASSNVTLSPLSPQ